MEIKFQIPKAKTTDDAAMFDIANKLISMPLKNGNKVEGYVVDAKYNFATEMIYVTADVNESSALAKRIALDLSDLSLQ